MKVFFKRTFLFLALPLTVCVLIIGSYLYFDPFKVVRSYADYSGLMVEINRDHVSTQIYLRQRKQHHYNAFIFGSSRTRAFRTASWKKHLPPNAVPFVFDAFCETVFGIYKKVHFLDSTQAPLKYALVILCRNANFVRDGNFYHCMYVTDPATSGEDYLKYQLTFLKTYTDLNFLKAYFFAKFRGYQSWMGRTLRRQPIIYDTISNDQTQPETERALAKNPEKYYEDHEDIFYKRSGEITDTIPRITGNNRFMLEEIARIFRKNHTEYKIVLSPLYEQVKFHPQDMDFLKSIFGNHIYDFTGANYFTNDIHHYYEDNHYRPFVGDSIMDIIYKAPAP